jgi:putative transposase
MSDLLGVSASGYFEHMRRKDSARKNTEPSRASHKPRISNEALLAHIRAIHAEFKQEYGWPTMWKELLARVMRVGEERVRCMMQKHGIKTRSKRQHVVECNSVPMPVRMSLDVS